jgi:pyruvate dehydrogenase E1 component beta subunit
MLQQAIACDDPVIFYEPKRRYWDKAEVRLGVPDSAEPGFDKARVVLEGSDVTLVAYGPTTRTALDVAQIAAGEGRSVEVIDLRSLSPLDMPTLVGSAAKTGRVIVVHEAPTFLGLGAEIAAAITEQCFHHLEAPVLRVGGYNIPYPPARAEEDYLPDLDRVLDAIDRALAY